MPKTVDHLRVEKAPGPIRVSLLILIGIAAVATSFWRTRVGLQFLPGLFTVVFLPLSVALFVGLDLWIGFSTWDWVAVTALVIVHLAFSVPAFPGAIYYMGSHLVRPDHFVHLFAGGLVAWLCWRVLRKRLPPERRSPRTIGLLAVLMALGFGALKETTDFLSVRASDLHYDRFDSAADFSANFLGATITIAWCLVRLDPSRREEVTDARAGEPPSASVSSTPRNGSGSG